MRLQKYLTEKFFDAFKYGSRNIDIWVNPSKKELRDLYMETKDNSWGSIGFICDITNDKIYFFSRKHIIHQDAFNHIDKSNRRLYKDSTFLTGEMEMGNGKVNNINFNSFKSFSNTEVIKEMLDLDWSFFDKWIPNLNEKLKHYFKNYLDNY